MTIIHVIVSLGLIVIVLLQTGKGADIGAVFGGSSSTIFGSSGAGNFLTRLTTALAIVFMTTSLTLGYFSVNKPASSVLDRVRVPPRQSAPLSKTTPGQTSSSDKPSEPTPRADQSKPQEPPAR